MVAQVQGVGLGLRLPLAAELFEQQPPEVDWLEIHPDNYVQRGGRYANLLERAASRWPLVAHGLTLCFGNIRPFDRTYVRDLKRLLDRHAVPWYSDHLCFGSADGTNFHDLLPLPLCGASIKVAVQRVRELQDALERPVAVENVSFYAHPGAKSLDEAEVVAEVVDRANASLLLDVNNVFVNSKNHGFDPRAYIDRMPRHRVVEIHVAGHWVESPKLRIDTHAEAVCAEVYELLAYALRRVGRVPVLLERDDNFPPLSVLVEELRELQRIYADATNSRAAAAPQQAQVGAA